MWKSEAGQVQVFIYLWISGFGFPLPEAAHHCHTFIPAPLTPFWRSGMICLLPVGHDDPAAGDYFGCPRWCERLERPMTALPLWRPELSLESCPVEETEDSQAPSNQTQAAPIPKWQTCYFPPPSITSTSSLASRSATSCPRAPSSPGLNPPIKSYLTNLPPTNISSPLKFPPTLCTKGEMHNSWLATRPCRFPPQGKSRRLSHLGQSVGGKLNLGIILSTFFDPNPDSLSQPLFRKLIIWNMPHLSEEIK